MGVVWRCGARWGWVRMIGWSVRWSRRRRWWRRASGIGGERPSEPRGAGRVRRGAGHWGPDGWWEDERYFSHALLPSTEKCTPRHVYTMRRPASTSLFCTRLGARWAREQRARRGGRERNLKGIHQDLRLKYVLDGHAPVSNTPDRPRAASQSVYFHHPSTISPLL